MELTQKELMQALTRRFLSLTIDDGTVHSGYIGNPEDFQGETMPPTIVLINGLLRDEIEVARVTAVDFPKREDTTSIKVI